MVLFLAMNKLIVIIGAICLLLWRAVTVMTHGVSDVALQWIDKVTRKQQALTFAVGGTTLTLAQLGALAQQEYAAIQNKITAISQGSPIGVDPASRLAESKQLQRQKFQTQEQMQLVKFFQGQGGQQAPGVTNVTNINFQGTNVVDDNTLQSFVRKITTIQNQQQNRVFGSIA